MELFANKHYFRRFDPPNNPLFCGTHDWDCVVYDSQPLPPKKMRSLAEFIALDSELSTLLKKIAHVLDYIILLRDESTVLRAEKLSQSLVYILNMDLAGSSKAQLVRNQWLDWAYWMQAIGPSFDLLREECCDLGADLMVCLTTQRREL